MWQVIVFAVALVYLVNDSIVNMNIVYFIILMIVCALIASPITMACIYVFYRIYIHNIQNALTEELVTDWYKQLEQPKETPRGDNHLPIETKSSKLKEDTPLLYTTEQHEGGEFGDF